MGVISVKNLGKAYKQYRNRWARLAEWVIPGCKPQHTLKWVLQDINFKINSGEAVGIIGVNGAGKSTLLKMITGTTQPSVGEVQITGRVAALLELGMGFHPDFTGRQNVFMAGQLLGFSIEEISRLMPEIESFAEIGDYLDQPVRVYSSGMQVRLAFSVATAVRPDILIIDEALSVGDVLFQQKCMAKILSFREQGTTLLLVSHDTTALHAICDSAIVLGGGRCLYQGNTKEAVEIYLELIGVAKEAPEAISLDRSALLMDQIADDKQATGYFSNLDQFIESVDFVDDNGEILQVLVEGKPFSICFHLSGLDGFKDPHVGFRIQDRLGLVVYETNTYCQGFYLESELVCNSGNLMLTARCVNNMTQGEYSLAIGIEQEGYGDGAFKKIICPTKVYRSFIVVRESGSPLWGGATNLHPEFSCKLALPKSAT